MFLFVEQTNQRTIFFLQKCHAKGQLTIMYSLSTCTSEAQEYAYGKKRPVTQSPIQGCRSLQAVWDIGQLLCIYVHGYLKTLRV